MREIGVNTWVWVSPLTDARLGELADRARGFGFDLLELPVERLHGWDAGAAAEALAASDMGARIVGAMGPGRDLIDETARADTQDYLRLRGRGGSDGIADRGRTVHRPHRPGVENGRR